MTLKAAQPLAEQLGQLLLQHKLTLVIAESCTGGGVAYEITRVPGSSQWFDRGFVTYSNQAKEAMLGVKAGTLSTFGAVSEEVAAEMARGALRHSLAQVSVSVTGIAGPSGGTPEKPVGLVCFAWAHINGGSKSHTKHFQGDRHAIREEAIHYALEGFMAWLSSYLAAPSGR